MRDYKVHWEERCKGRIRIYEGTEDSGLKGKCGTSGWCVKYVPKNFTWVFKKHLNFLLLPIFYLPGRQKVHWVVLLECNYYLLGHECKILQKSGDGGKGGFMKFNTFAVTLQFSSVTGERFGLQPRFSVSCIPGFAYQIWNLFGMFAIKIPTRELTSARK